MAKMSYCARRAQWERAPAVTSACCLRIGRDERVRATRADVNWRRWGWTPARGDERQREPIAGPPGESQGEGDWLREERTFLQGSETDQTTVDKIREAIREQKEVTVQLINYTKSGKKFWNLFHLQPMWDQKVAKYYRNAELVMELAVTVTWMEPTWCCNNCAFVWCCGYRGSFSTLSACNLIRSDHVEPLRNRLSENTEIQSAKLVKATAGNVDEAVRELPDANLRPEDLWAVHSLSVFPKPHKRNNSSWKAIEKIMETGEKIGLKHFKPVKPLGCGDTGSVHLVELQGSGELFAMKAMDKSVMLNRNKVHRAIIEREIYSLLDHPFLSTLYTSFQVT
ncbi:phototropin-2 [Hordeum vulgare]|nr:phototropin-2 [Hordeum vulgare]